jgi:hypothetical protein
MSGEGKLPRNPAWRPAQSVPDGLATISRYLLGAHREPPPTDDAAPTNPTASSADSELTDIVHEESSALLAHIGGQLVIWQARPDDPETPNVLRRAFHNLQRSGRLVGASAAGELAGAMEGLLGRVAQSGGTLTLELSALLETVLLRLPRLLEEPGTGAEDVAALAQRAEALPARYLEAKGPEKDELAHQDARMKPQQSDTAPARTAAAPEVRRLPVLVAIEGEHPAHALQAGSLIQGLERELRRPTGDGGRGPDWKVHAAYRPADLPADHGPLILVFATASQPGVRHAYTMLKQLHDAVAPLPRVGVMLSGGDAELGVRSFERLAEGARRFLNLPLTNYGHVAGPGPTLGAALMYLAQQVHSTWSRSRPTAAPGDTKP